MLKQILFRDGKFDLLNLFMYGYMDGYTDRNKAIDHHFCRNIHFPTGGGQVEWWRIWDPELYIYIWFILIRRI